MEKDRKIMIIIKRLVTRLTLTALMIPAAYASIPDCADDQNGTISPVQNLVNGCYIYASEIEPSSMAKSVLKLWAADGVQLSSAQEVIDQLNRLAIYSPGYGVNNVTWVSNTDNFVNYNGLDHVINSGAFVPASDKVELEHIDENYNFPFISTYSALDIDRPITQADSVVQALADLAGDTRSEERRVGKECRARWAPDQ